MMTLTFATLALSTFLAQAPSGAVPPADSTALAAQDARFAAMVAGDLARLSEMLDDTLTYQHSTGVAETKSQFLEGLRTGRLKYKAIDVLERQVRRFGTVAVITAVVRVQATNNGEALDTKMRVTDVYARRDARYRQVAWQSTRLP